MITVIFNYVKATDIVLRTNNRIFDKLEEMAPHIYILSKERKEFLTNEIEELITLSMIESLKLTCFHDNLLKKGLFSNAKIRLALKCYNSLGSLRRDEVKNRLKRLNRCIDTQTMNELVTLFDEANRASTNKARKYIRAYLKVYGYILFN